MWRSEGRDSVELHSKKVYMVVIDTFVEFLPHHFFLAMLCIMKKSIKMQSSLLKALKKDLQCGWYQSSSFSGSWCSFKWVHQSCTVPCKLSESYWLPRGKLGICSEWTLTRAEWSRMTFLTANSCSLGQPRWLVSCSLFVG